MTLQTALYPVASANSVQHWVWLASAGLSKVHTVSPGALIWGLVAVFLVGIPLSDSLPFIGTYDSQRLCEVVLLLCAAALMQLPEEQTHGQHGFRLLPRRARQAIGGMFVLGLLSALLAPRPRYALLEVASFLLMGALAVQLASFFLRQRASVVSLISPVLIVSVGSYLVVFLIGHLQAIAQTGTALWPRVLTGFVHIRMFNQWQVWVTPLLISLVVLAPPGRERWWLRSLPAGMVMLLIASGGRGATLALIGSVVLVGMVYRRAARGWLREAAIATGLGGLLYLILFRVLASDNLSVLDRAGLGASGRDLLWAKGLGLIAEHPLLGYGPMHFAYDPSPLAAHPHNLVLQWAAEWGLPAAGLLMGLVVWGSAAWLVRTRKLVQQGSGSTFWLVGLTGAFSAALANSLVDGSVIAPLSQVGWIVLGALLLVAYRRVGAEEKPAPVSVSEPACSGSRWASRLVISAAALVMVVNIGIDGPTLHRRDYDYRAVRFSRKAPLRYWSQGRIAHVDDPEVLRQVEELARQLAADR